MTRRRLRLVRGTTDGPAVICLLTSSSERRSVEGVPHRQHGRESIFAAADCGLLTRELECFWVLKGGLRRGGPCVVSVFPSCSRSRRCFSSCCRRSSVPRRVRLPRSS